MNESMSSSLSRWKGRALSCALFLGLAWLGCGSDPEPQPSPGDAVAPGRVQLTAGVTAGEFITGQRRLEAVAEDDSGTVAKVAFYVSNVLACADNEAKASGATFGCVWNASQTPEGDYVLTVAALDSSGNTTTSAPIAFSVGVRNEPPVFTEVTAAPATVNEGQGTTLTARASDPEGRALSYTWTQRSPASPQGTFNNANASNPTWTAPLLSTRTTFTLQVAATDERGGAAVSSVDVVVANDPSANRPPTVDSAITGPITVLSGDSIALSIGASDPDGDPLTYSWRTNPADLGAFTNGNTASATWRSAEVTSNSPRTVQVQVVVSDGVASVTRSLNVQVTVPTYSEHIQFIWNEACVSCHDNTSPSGNLNLLQGSSYANLVNVTGNNTSCGTLRRVRPGFPDTSLLVRKLSATNNCGGRMPRNNTAYFDNNPGYVTRIRSWIIAGAPNN
ncbi:PKD domain-containing protein [Hyalangium rubrum]|uniref:Ig-like domain-containing protein n=1 Tax=Hyalangium rubrum TaxID=3103134 RepID=A0ABU5HHY6_9BACT|nr:Ig-like domain-containing protein [Hyalangium sp. s54d21]MDY7232438.1 Ig-like domain-containing protein [Hyalangium sp. s54d21]